MWNTSHLYYTPGCFTWWSSQTKRLQWCQPVGWLMACAAGLRTAAGGRSARLWRSKRLHMHTGQSMQWWWDAPRVGPPNVNMTNYPFSSHSIHSRCFPCYSSIFHSLWVMQLMSYSVLDVYMHNSKFACTCPWKSWIKNSTSCYITQYKCSLPLVLPSDSYNDMRPKLARAEQQSDLQMVSEDDTVPSYKRRKER